MLGASSRYPVILGNRDITWQPQQRPPRRSAPNDDWTALLSPYRPHLARPRRPPIRELALRRVVHRVEVSESGISVMMNRSTLEQLDGAARPDDDGDELTTIELPFDIVRRDNGARVLATGGSMPSVDSSASALVKAVARGYAWRQQLLDGSARSTAEIARKEGITRRYVARLLRLGFLAPDIMAAILANRQPAHMTVDRLRGPIPLDWYEQRRLFGFDATGRGH